MIGLSVIGDSYNHKSRSFLEAAMEYKGVYGVSGYWEDADCFFLPDYTCLGTARIKSLLKAGKHILLGGAGASGMDELQELVRTAEENHAVLLEYLHSAFNPCTGSLEKALRHLGPIYHVRLYSCQYSFCCRDIHMDTAPGQRQSIRGGALFQRGMDCIYPLVRIFGRPVILNCELVLSGNGLDAAGSINGKLGAADVELVYSKISGSHIPSLIQGQNGSLLIGDLHDFHQITYYGPSGTEESLISCSGPDCRRAELAQCMDYLSGSKDWHEQLPVSYEIQQMINEIVGR